VYKATIDKLDLDLFEMIWVTWKWSLLWVGPSLRRWAL